MDFFFKGRETITVQVTFREKKTQSSRNFHKRAIHRSRLCNQITFHQKKPFPSTIITITISRSTININIIIRYELLTFNSVLTITDTTCPTPAPTTHDHYSNSLSAGDVSDVSSSGLKKLQTDSIFCLFSTRLTSIEG